MKHVTGSIWNFWGTSNAWVVVPTNGFVKKDHRAVMGRGIAFEARKKFPDLTLALGWHLERRGNHVAAFDNYQLITFPVKKDWWDLADLDLIRRSTDELLEVVAKRNLTEVYIPRVGCGNGGRSWLNEVREIVEPKLDERFILVTWDR